MTDWGGAWWAIVFAAAVLHVAPSRADLPQLAPAAGAGGPTVRMTMEVGWSVPPNVDPPTVDLAMSEGRILGVVALPGPSDPSGAPQLGRFAPNPRGVWRIGGGIDRWGRVRVRVEAPLGASLHVEAAGQVVPFVLVGLVEGPQRSAPPAKLDINVERVSWDTIEVGSEGDGLAAPGSSLPLTVGLNVLSPDASEVQVRLTAELRPIAGGEPIWRQDVREVVPTNSLTAPSLILPIRVPEAAAEGAYVLDFHAAWEPVASGSNSRSLLGLSRLLRRRKAPSGKGEAHRGTTLVVTASDGNTPKSPKAPAKAGSEIEVDTVDFARPRGYRPSASGRAPTQNLVGPAWRVPEAAFVEATRRDRLRGWISRASAEPVVLPEAEAEGLAWTAVGLKAPRPDRPHRLSLTVLGTSPGPLGVAVVAPGSRPHIVLDAVTSPGSGKPSGGAAGTGSKPAPAVTFSWIVWPEVAEPVLVLVNRDGQAPIRLGSATLTELSELSPGDGTAPSASGPRWVGLSVNSRQIADRFGGDSWSTAKNLGRYATTIGANAVVLPDSLADRARRQALDGQAAADSLGPDRLDLTLSLLDRQGLAAWVELDLDGPMPGLPGPETPEALADGLIRLDRRGHTDGPPSYLAIHPKVREALARKATGIAARRRDRGNLAGLVIRLGRGPTLLGRPDTGLDDETFQRFVAETFSPNLAKGIPGLADQTDQRYPARAVYVEGAGRAPWLAWRSKQIAELYAELSRSVRAAAPGSALAVVTPGLEDGPVGDETRKLDLVGLGPDQAWKAVGFDLAAWPLGEEAPVVWRGVTPGGPGELEHDLATSPELDEGVATRPRRGMALLDGSGGTFPGLPLPIDDGLSLNARPAAADDGPLGHALAAFDARWIMLTPDAVAGREEQIRKFARLVSSLPSPVDQPIEIRKSTGVVTRSRNAAGGTETVVSAANDTPYEILLDLVLNAPADAKVFDLGRSVALNAETVDGGKRVILKLAPHGVSALSIGAPDVSISTSEVYPGVGVLNELKARSEVISATLVRLNRAAGEEEASTPANAGFEPPPGSEIRVTRVGMMGEMQPHGTFPATGWKTIGEASIEIDTERPKAGQGSLRLVAKTAPASAVSDSFSPAGRPTLFIQGWLRADRPDTKVRVWIEGQAAGRAFSRSLDVVAWPDWRPTSLRAAGIPGGGLDTARLRFELTEPGKLWIDDLNVSGPVLTEPERLNARRDLLAALSAFREKRYGDFARLSGSHWARHVSTDGAGATFAASPSAIAERPGRIRTGDIGGSGLPTPRPLR